MKADIVRGIVTTVYGKNYKKLVIETPMYIYDVNTSAIRFQLDEGEKVLGVVVNNKFNICFDICTDRISDDKEIGFGYVISSHAKKGSYSFRKIDRFNRLSYNPYKPAYTLGEEINISIRQIKNITVDFNPFITDKIDI